MKLWEIYNFILQLSHMFELLDTTYMLTTHSCNNFDWKLCVLIEYMLDNDVPVGWYSHAMSHVMSSFIAGSWDNSWEVTERTFS